MTPPSPLEVCVQISREHATNTIGALHAERAARLGDALESHGRALSELADELGRVFNDKEEASE